MGVAHAWGEGHSLCFKRRIGEEDRRRITTIISRGPVALRAG